MIDVIREILNCDDKPLLSKIEQAIANFDNLDLSKKYHLAFSGGKDSHALLIIFLLWQKIRNVNTDNFTVLFADTLLETSALYSLITTIENTVFTVKIERVKPEHSYWWYQFAYGFPVPDHFNRWCTRYLKVNLMKNRGTPITGRHYGESSARDARISSCSSGECGVDKIKTSIDPIVNFRNCDVWDLIFYSDGTCLYEGVFDSLKSTYNQSEDTNGSLRMGCFMCPVISINTLKKSSDRYAFVSVREFLEELRKCQRINSPRTKKRGAIYVSDRRIMWQKLNKELLLSLGYITQSEIELISECLESDYSYPKTYAREWIDCEHKRLEQQTIYTGLPLFEYAGK